MAESSPRTLPPRHRDHRERNRRSGDQEARRSDAGRLALFATGVAPASDRPVFSWTLELLFFLCISVSLCLCGPVNSVQCPAMSESWSPEASGRRVEWYAATRRGGRFDVA